MRSRRQFVIGLPEFSGVARNLVRIIFFGFVATILVQVIVPGSGGRLIELLLLEPKALAHGFLWQPLTYSFVPSGFLHTFFALITMWYLGGFLENQLGGKRVLELFFVSAIGGAVLASALCYVPFLRLDPEVYIDGLGASMMGIGAAMALLFGDQPLDVFFVLRMNARTALVFFISISIILLWVSGYRVGAANEFCGGLCGFLYAKYCPRRGFAFGASERYFGLRNNYYRWKRRKAARKFEVYMGKQGRTVKFDKDGKYVEPDDPEDKKWMN